MGTAEIKPQSDWARGFTKAFGSVIKRADQKKVKQYRGTGSIALDIALGGGWGKATVVQLFGREGSGKTLLFEMAAVEAQRIEKKRSLIFDFEGTFDVLRFISIGGDPKMLDVISHDSCVPMLLADTAFDMLKAILMSTDNYAVVCFDSTAAMLAKAEYEKKMESGQESYTPFHLSRVMSEGLKITTGLVSNNPALPTIMFVSQGRDNIHGAGFRGLPPPDKQTGGRALPFYSSTRVEVKKADLFKADVEQLGLKEIEVGHTTKVIVRKNKMNGAQGRVASFDMYTEGDVKGIDRVSELITLAGYAHTIEKSGSDYILSDERVKGVEKLKEVLRARPKVFADLYARTKAKLAEIMDDKAEILPIAAEDQE